jgi:tartrate dehydratase beta subunit/fumarate hydratase class I family protein
MPVTVAVDSQGTNIHATGPAEWATHIAQSLPGTAALQ